MCDIRVHVCAYTHACVSVCMYMHVWGCCVHVCLSMCVHSCVYMCMCVSVCVHVYVCACVYVCVHMCACVCLWVGVHVHTYVHIYVRVCMCACVYVCMCAWGKQRVTSNVGPYLLPCFLRWGLPMAWSLPNKLDWLAIKPLCPLSQIIEDFSGIISRSHSARDFCMVCRALTWFLMHVRQVHY